MWSPGCCVSSLEELQPPAHRMMGMGTRSPVFWLVVESRLYPTKQTQELGYSTMGHDEEASH